MSNKHKLYDMLADDLRYGMKKKLNQCVTSHTHVLPF